MGYRYVVFGTGRQGTAAIYDLLSRCEADAVLAIDPKPEAMQGAAGRMCDLLGPEADRLTTATNITPQDLCKWDVVLSCAPYRFNPQLTRLALDAGVAFCDLGGNPHVVAQQQRMVQNRPERIPVVPDCGISPGISNILAVHLCTKHAADRVRVRCGGVPITASAADNPLKYKLVFDPQGLISEYSGEVPVIRDGRLATVDALSTIEPFGDGRFECAPTSNNSPQVVRYLLERGVRDYDYMTIRYPGHWQRARQWKAEGFLSGDEQQDAKLIARLASDASLQYNPDVDRDRLVLSVCGSRPVGAAARGFRKHIGFELDVPADTATRLSAMELTTSWGITIVAHYLARNASTSAVPGGFATPEQFIDSDWVVAELDRRVTEVR
jgi:saccharopine dehydrogenase-like NADP-dependent oxidoreductase